MLRRGHHQEFLAPPAQGRSFLRLRLGVLLGEPGRRLRILYRRSLHRRHHRIRYRARGRPLRIHQCPARNIARAPRPGHRDPSVAGAEPREKRTELSGSPPNSCMVAFRKITLTEGPVARHQTAGARRCMPFPRFPFGEFIAGSRSRWPSAAPSCWSWDGPEESPIGW